MDELARSNACDNLILEFFVPVPVISGESVDGDRYGQGDHEDADDGADAAKNLAQSGCRCQNGMSVN